MYLHHGFVISTLVNIFNDQHLVAIIIGLYTQFFLRPVIIIQNKLVIFKIYKNYVYVTFLVSSRICAINIDMNMSEYNLIMAINLFLINQLPFNNKRLASVFTATVLPQRGYIQFSDILTQLS